MENSPGFLGYSRMGGERTAGRVDAREGFEFAGGGRELKGEPQGDQVWKQLLSGGNQWIDLSAFQNHEMEEGGGGARDVANLREAVEKYMTAMRDLAERFLGLVEEALELGPGVLKAFTAGAQDRMKLVHYSSREEQHQGKGSVEGSDPRLPPSGDVEVSSSPEQQQQLKTPEGSQDTTRRYVQGVGPHKDSSGWMTFLLQTQPDSTPDTNGRGLQALTKSGLWIDIPPIPNTFVVNMGQAFEAVTNGLCQATTHRVLLPPGSFTRYSVPFFQGVRLDLTKRDVKSLWGGFEERAERWEDEGVVMGRESVEARGVDSPFLRGDFETWGEAQLRIKMRSHREVGRRWHGDLFERFVWGDG